MPPKQFGSGNDAVPVRQWHVRRATLLSIAGQPAALQRPEVIG